MAYQGLKAKVIVPHSIDCFMNGKENPWSGCIDEDEPFFFGNFNANKNATIGRYHIWVRVVCNDPSCPAIKAVHSSVLVEA